MVRIFRSTRMKLQHLLVVALTVTAACGEDQSPTGGVNWSLAVDVTTIGHSFDPDGYDVRVNGEEAGRLTQRDTLFLYGLDAGPYSVELANVAANCRTAPAASQNIALSSGGNARTSYVVDCDSTLSGVILFTRVTPVASGGPGTSEIMHVRPDGSSLHRLTAGSQASVSPDGREMVLYRNFSIYRMNVDGTRAVDLTPATSTDQCAAWSPRGDLIAFSSARSGEYQIYTMRPDGSDQRRITFSNLQEACGVSWSPDGSRLVFGRGDALFVINVDGTGEQKLADNVAGSPSWSPDGSRIAFNSARSGTNQLWLIQSDGQSPQQLTSDPVGVYGQPVWSPGGEEIVFDYGGVDLPTLYKLQADGTISPVLVSGNFWDRPSQWLR